MAKKPKFDDPEEQQPEMEGVGEDELSEDGVIDPEGFDEDEHEGLSAEQASDSDLSADDEDLIQLKADIEERLLQRTASANAAQVQAEDACEGAGNIVGVGIGAPYLDFTDSEPGRPVLNVYVVEPTTIEVVKRQIVDSMGVSAASSDDVHLNLFVTGQIDALSHRFKIRPAPGGVSVGHFRITAGTLGCLARGRSGERRRRVLVLSNNHVLANSNSASEFDSIIQPGRADGGKNTRDRIAVLERFVNIRFGGQANFVDCATGWTWHQRVRRELVYLRNGQRRFFRISSQLRDARRGMLVGKSGRTTQLTAGRVTDVSATIQVNYGFGRVALFRDQIAVRGLSGDFSRGGDSGSAIWSWDTTRNPVGLLFAGGGGMTFANKMSRVLTALDINLYT